MDSRKIIVGGKFEETTTMLNVINPSDGTTDGTTFIASEGLIERAVSSAHASFAETKRLPAHIRSSILSRIADTLSERRESLSKEITLQTAKPINDSRREIDRCVEVFKTASSEALRIGGEILPLETHPIGDGRFGLWRAFPAGVALAITPFNFPANLVAHKIAPAIAVGCPIILKPSSKTPFSAISIGDIAISAGYPKEAISIMPMSYENIDLLLVDPRIAILTFTGSADVGWAMKEKAYSKKVTLELGGNAACVIEPDADISYAAKRCVVGAFSFAGQSCISLQRLYLHKSIEKRFLSAFIPLVKLLKTGNPMDETTELGPMIDEPSAKKAERWIKEALNDGAKGLCGGPRKGNFLPATVLSNVKKTQSISCQEAFAPIVVIYTYENLNEAIREINSSEFGLQAGIFTSNMNSILNFYENVEVGGVIVNDVPTWRVDPMPYGGVKRSGFGREGVRFAMEEMCERKLLVLKR